ncbi:3-oxoacyl-ACP synthase [Bacteroidia bacterium]|nr:3-oxoacyl-ACP synthase [Bacteroidia bacterium]
MAFFEFKNVKIAGIAAGVPANITLNNEQVIQSEDYDANAFVETTGVRQRRVSETLTTSDLCFAAADKLISDLEWDKSEIEMLVFVSQTADYILPATACILQERLGLSKECYAEDIALGCSGWVYGLSNVVSLLSTGSIKKALLFAGDAKKRAKEILNPLFGHAGTVTALEYIEGEKGFQFHFGTDGSGYDSIIILDGGSRNQVSPQSFELENFEGKQIHRLQTRMKGMDVFAFGISVPPKSIKKLAEHYGFDYLDADYFIFHQANMKMNEKIRTKLKLEADKVPYSMPNFGNTSSASIPLTIVSELKGKIENKPAKFICCGFGVGLSWGTVAFETDNLVISDLVELNLY